MASRWWLLLPRPIRELPADLAAVALLTVLAAFAALVPGIDETPIRVVFGLPLVLFLPGYALVAALFPEAAGGEEDERRGIDGIERVALSFGLSIAVTPLFGLVLNFTPWGIRLLPILIAVGGFTLLATSVAALRRRDLPADERFTVPYSEWIDATRSELLEPETTTDAALNVLLAVSVLVAVASVGFAVAMPQQGEAFTEFYLLTQDDDGDLVASGYPTEFVQGEPQPVVVGIGNHEHRSVTYTGVVELQSVRTANNTTTVLEERELQRFRTEVGANETWTDTRSITPTMTGERLRLAFLLYEGDPPESPSTENAYREVHLWVNVSAPNRST